MQQDNSSHVHYDDCFSLLVFCLLSSLSPWIAFRHCFPGQVPRICVCLAFISDYCVDFISDCRIDKQQSVSTIRLNFLDMMDTAEMEQKPVEKKKKEFWRSERERIKNWATKRKLGNQQSKEKRFFFFLFLLFVCTQLK